jgi:two-component system chemotaxis response regulator CheY
MKKAILVVDDSPATRSLIASRFAQWGDFEFIEAGTGFEALKVFPGQTIDLVVTDINMPDINGLELIRYLKQNPRTSGIPLIIISTEANPREQEKGLALGAMRYLVKPFSDEDIREVVEAVFGGGSHGRA